MIIQIHHGPDHSRQNNFDTEKVTATPTTPYVRGIVPAGDTISSITVDNNTMNIWLHEDAKFTKMPDINVLLLKPY